MQDELNLPKNRNEILLFVGIVVFFLILTAWINWGLIQHLSSAIPSRGDALGSIFDIRLRSFDISNYGRANLDLSRDYPVGVTSSPIVEVLTTSVRLPTVVIARWLGEITAFNLIILFGTWATGPVTFGVLRRLDFEPLSAAFGSLLFFIHPFHLLAGRSWDSLSQTWVIPIFFLLGYRLRHCELSQTRWPSFLLLGFICLVNPYLTLVGLFIILISLVIRILNSIQNRFKSLESYSHSVLLDALLSFIAISIFTAIVFGSVKFSVDGFSRSSHELIVYGLRISDLLRVSYPLQFEIFSNARNFDPYLSGSNAVERAFYVGYLPLCLAIGSGFFKRVRNLRVWSFSVSLALVSVLVGMSQRSLLRPFLRSPSEYLLESFGVFRVFSRFGIATGFCVVILATIAIDRVAKSRGAGRVSVVIVIVLCVASVVEILPMRNPSVFDLKSPSYIDVVRDESVSGDPVLFLPLAGVDDSLRYERNYFSSSFKNPIVNGTAERDDLLKELGFGGSISAGTVAAGLLRSWGVSALIVDKRYASDEYVVSLGEEIFSDDDYSVRALQGPAIPFASVWHGGYGRETIGEHDGEWIGEAATVLVSSTDHKCLDVNFIMLPYGSLNSPELISGDGNVEVPVVFSVRVSVEAGLATLDFRSTSGTVNPDGPDERLLSAFVSIKSVEAAGDCKEHPVVHSQQ